ncbi:hypothetical protein [Snodgrassella communis]|uniref:hypothetical protein n=1 Tax=Snodgrassella communis TaxID=2946699 RepID=UPI001EF60EC6|nr:hypothetical protein [Snodgrassella communis]WMY91215.1 hypothetical protein PYG29_07155 [Snodgrassella communis]
MRTEEFNKCREFLEGQIMRTPDNKELIAAYQKLLELKSIYDTEIHISMLDKKARRMEFQQQVQTTVSATENHEEDISTKDDVQNYNQLQPNQNNLMANQKNWYNYQRIQHHHFGDN